MNIKHYQKIFCNRSLNMRNIRGIGFDMDYTLAVYEPETFENLAYRETIYKLVQLGYPEELLGWQFDANFMIRGLAIDKQRGNIIKMDRHRYVKLAYHGFTQLSRDERRALYDSSKIEFYDEPNFSMVDTLFSLAEAYLFTQIVEFKRQNTNIIKKNFMEIFSDVRSSIDLCHRDGSIKKHVHKNPHLYIKKDTFLKKTLLHIKESGRKTFIVTNSLWDYTSNVMNYLLGDNWTHYFDVIITGAQKPHFFTNLGHLYEVETSSGLLKLIDESNLLESNKKIFHGGNFKLLQKILNINSGPEILYIGDHIYGDILRSKKDLGWRTMLIVEELEKEIMTLISQKENYKIYNSIIEKKDMLENEIYRIKALIDKSNTRNKDELVDTIDKLVKERAEIRHIMRTHLKDYHERFHPIWGELMKTGYQNSRFAAQVESYACLYTSRVSNLMNYQTHITFRSTRDFMPHDFTDDGLTFV